MPMNSGEWAKALITSHLQDDLKSQIDLRAEITVDDLSGIAGALLAYTGNLIKLISIHWDCTPSEAWEKILAAERNVKMRGGGL